MTPALRDAAPSHGSLGDSRGADRSARADLSVGPHAQMNRAHANKSIFIDGRNLDLEKGTGVATYARNLSFALHDLGYRVGVLYGGRAAPSHAPLMKEIAFFDSNAGDVPRWLQILRNISDGVRAPAGFPATRVPITGQVISDGFKSRLPYYDVIWNSPDLFRKGQNVFGWFDRLHKVYIGDRPDLMHWTYPLPLKVPRSVNIYTLHDLVPLKLPYTTLDNKRRYLRLVSRICKSADHVVTVSEASRRDIIQMLGISPDRVTNTYQAVTIPAKYADKDADTVAREVEGTFGLEYKNYYLFYGSIEPKKNIGRIIEGYLASRVSAPLVIVGAQAWKSEQELRLLYDDHLRSLVREGSETKVRRKVIQLGYAPFPLLVSLIKGARATLFPSLYEGFGLPVLESMLLGTPVVSSTTSSIPEVAGDAAVLVDPYDSTAITSAIRRIDADADLRAELSQRGQVQAALYSQANYNARLAALYHKLL